jgi:hypothetical protein
MGMAPGIRRLTLRLSGLPKDGAIRDADMWTVVDGEAARSGGGDPWDQPPSGSHVRVVF